MAISQIVDSFAHYETEEQRNEFQALFRDKAKENDKRRRELIVSFLQFFALLVLGTIVSALGHSWDEGSKWANGFYFTVITLTTVGFGDFSPIEDWEKVYKSVMMLVGIPVFATCLGNLTQFLFAEAREDLKLRLVKGGLTPEKFEKFQEFSRTLALAGGGDGTGDERISPFEFLTFVLVENGVVQMKNITNTMNNFKEIDKSASGFIEKSR